MADPTSIAAMITAGGGVLATVIQAVRGGDVARDVKELQEARKKADEAHKTLRGDFDALVLRLGDHRPSPPPSPVSTTGQHPALREPGSSLADAAVAALEGRVRALEAWRAAVEAVEKYATAATARLERRLDEADRAAQEIRELLASLTAMVQGLRGSRGRGHDRGGDRGSEA